MSEFFNYLSLFWTCLAKAEEFSPYYYHTTPLLRFFLDLFLSIFDVACFYISKIQDQRLFQINLLEVQKNTYFMMKSAFIMKQRFALKQFFCTFKCPLVSVPIIPHHSVHIYQEHQHRSNDFREMLKILVLVILTFHIPQQLYLSPRILLYKSYFCCGLYCSADSIEVRTLLH